MLKNILLACAVGLVTWPAHAGKPLAPVKIVANAPAPLRPGQPGEIVVTFVPLAAMDQMKVVFGGVEGLALQSTTSHIFTAPAVGAPLTRQVTVMAASEGRFHASVIVTTDTAGVTLGRVISIPIVVGDPAKLEKAQTKAAPQVDATGERIKSLPAAEQMH